VGTSSQKQGEKIEAKEVKKKKQRLGCKPEEEVIV